MKIEIMDNKQLMRIHNNVQAVEISVANSLTLKLSYSNGTGYIDRLFDGEKCVISESVPLS